MALSTPTGFTSNDLVFQDDFNGTTLGSEWNKYTTSNAANGAPWNTDGSGGSTPGGPFNADYDVPSHVSVSNGALDLTAVQQPINGVNQGGVAQTFPVTSGAVSSYNNFEFTGGYLQISMKAPSGDGAWPGLWLMPGKGAGSSGDNFELDIQEGGFTGAGPANQNFAWHIHTPAGWFGGVVDTGVDLTAAFHTYAINWDPGKSITWYLDGKQIAQLTSAQAPIPNEPMELNMNMAVANSNAAGWHTALDSSTPSSLPMQVDGVQLYQKAGSGDTVTGANVTPGSTPSEPTTPPTTQPAVTQATASPATGVEHVGDKIALTLAFNEAVTVTGKPTLTLNDGGIATYVGGSGTGKLTFETTVASTNTSTSALGIKSVNLAGGSIKDASGLSANLSGAVTTFAGLQVDTTPVTTPPTPPPIDPAVTQATASPATGVEHVGDKIALTLGFNEAVTVTGKPTLTLNDGGIATYVGGSGTGKLTFETTVASTNTSTSALGIKSVNLAGGSIKDASGLSANLSGAVTTFAGLQVDTTPVTTPPTPPTTPPTPPTIDPAVTQATASPATGVEHVGDKIALTLAFNEAVTVTGKPTLTLNDGGIATYVGGSGTGKLTFETTVAAGNTSTSALGIKSVDLAGGSIKDAGGLSANLSGAVTTFAGLQVDTTPVTSGPTKPVVSVADNTLSVHPGGKVDLGIGVSTTDKDDTVSVNIKGLPRYETITDNLDGHTFRGKDITLTAAQVESGLTLHSNYRGSGEPTATLSVTATGKDPGTGTVATSATKTITVTDPPIWGGGSSPSWGGHDHDHNHSFALLSQSLAGGLQGRPDLGQIATAASQAASSWLNESLLTRPQH